MLKILFSRRLARFCFVGASGVIVNLLVLVSLVRVFNVSPLPAYAFALEISIISNFFLNHFYTFHVTALPSESSKRDSPQSYMSKLIRYNLVALVGAGISYVVFYLLYRGGLHYIPADLVAILAATAWNYYMSVKIVWKIVDE